MINSAEVTTLKSKRREIESSLRALQHKEQRSAKYFACKASASHMKVSKSHESSSTTSVTPQDPNATSGDATSEPGTFLKVALPVAPAQGAILWN